MFAIIKMFVFISLLFSVSIAEIIIQEDFSDPAFPPEGWSYTSESMLDSWGWTDSGQPGNGYAHGEVVLNLPKISGIATLKTYYFTLNQGNTLHITFDRRNEWQGVQPDAFMFTMQVCRGDEDLYSMIFTSPSSSWTGVEFTQNIGSSSDEWNIRWEIYGLSEQSDPSTLYFDVDNVLAEVSGSAVAPTSLGNIKAAFH